MAGSEPGGPRRGRWPGGPGRPSRGLWLGVAGADCGLSARPKGPSGPSGPKKALRFLAGGCGGLGLGDRTPGRPARPASKRASAEPAARERDDDDDLGDERGERSARPGGPDGCRLGAATPRGEIGDGGGRLGWLGGLGLGLGSLAPEDAATATQTTHQQRTARLQDQGYLRKITPFFPNRTLL